MDDFVSVIIPCRNEAEFLGRCLDSILAGDYPAGRMEVLVVDGRSEDGTREVAGSYAARVVPLNLRQQAGHMAQVSFTVPGG